jgi:hypothetical protein
VSGRRVSGSLFDRTFEPKEHHFCTGTATYDLAGTRGAATPPARHGKGHGGKGATTGARKPPHVRAASWFAPPEPRYYDAGSERTAHGPRKNPANPIELGFRIQR